jgi:hypothetical protein
MMMTISRLKAKSKKIVFFIARQRNRESLFLNKLTLGDFGYPKIRRMPKAMSLNFEINELIEIL